MSHEFRPRRSVLYMPGSNARAIEKGRDLACDALILDLEDAVAPGSKDLARAQVAEAVNAGGFGAREVVVRINALESNWGVADLAVMAQVPLDGLLLPKVESAAQLAAIAEQARAIRGGPVPLWIMVETPGCVLNLQEVAGVSADLRVLVLGTNDLGLALRLPVGAGNGAFMPIRTHCVLAARARGIDVLDGVYNDLEDAAGLEQECLEAWSLGFDGKTLIHPNQIDVANRVFSPAPSEVARARALVEFWDATDAAGVARFDGRMVEELHVQAARRLLAIADSLMEPSAN